MAISELDLRFASTIGRGVSLISTGTSSPASEITLVAWRFMAVDSDEDGLPRAVVAGLSRARDRVERGQLKTIPFSEVRARANAKAARRSRS